MCGITGIFAFNEIGRMHMIHLANATAKLEKRGPDNQGLFNDHYVGLGHRRLSIIDTSSLANQPMQDSSSRYTLVFNGEIYNYKVLKQQLLEKEVTFQSESDSEVLLQLYIHFKEQCLDMLNGFFAFAIYDEQEQSLFVARDRYGIKPMLYYLDEDKFIFASEMKALLAYNTPKEINYSALYTYLQLNYIPAPISILKNVNKLMPGQYALIKDKSLSIYTYYNLKTHHSELPLNEYIQQQNQVRTLLEQAVQRRLVADVPLGTFLSGGIDSSIVSGLASKHVRDLHTFSIGYQDEKFFDETHYANIAAKHFGTKHTVFSLSNKDLYHALFDILEYIDEPFADSSAIPVYILSQLTKKQVTVALSGDGADELFAGYNKHQAFWHALHPDWKATLIKQFLPLWKALPQSRNSAIGNKIRQLQRFAEGMRQSTPERYWRWASFAQGPDAKQLLTASAQSQVDLQAFEELKNQYLSTLQAANPTINDHLLADQMLVLPNDMLTKVDLMSMANALEVRVPFLDHAFVDYINQLPSHAKVNQSMKKRMLQDAFRDFLPTELYNRPKHGFEVPLLKWLRTDLSNLIKNEWLNRDFIKEQGIFDVQLVDQLLHQLHSNNPGDSHARVWGLIVFQSWWKRYF